MQCGLLLACPAVALATQSSFERYHMDYTASRVVLLLSDNEKTKPPTVLDLVDHGNDYFHGWKLPQGGTPHYRHSLRLMELDLSYFEGRIDDFNAYLLDCEKLVCELKSRRSAEPRPVKISHRIAWMDERNQVSRRIRLPSGSTDGGTSETPEYYEDAHDLIGKQRRGKRSDEHVQYRSTRSVRR